MKLQQQSLEDLLINSFLVKKEEVLEIKPDPLNPSPPVAVRASRYGLRERRTQKYSQFDEDYFIQCQEQEEEPLKVKNTKIIILRGHFLF